MSHATHPFLRLELIRFQRQGKQNVDLAELKTEIEIREKDVQTRVNATGRRRLAGREATSLCSFV
jgi:hypothetical protein